MFTLIPMNYSCLIEMGGLALMVAGLGIAVAIAAIWVMRVAIRTDQFVLR
jgi:hypothetical protein